MTHKLAVIGIEATFGDARGIDSFDRHIVDGIFCSVPFPKKRQDLLEQQLGRKINVPTGSWLQTDKTPVGLIKDLVDQAVAGVQVSSSTVDLLLVSDCVEDQADLLDFKDSIRSLSRYDSVGSALSAAAQLVQKDSARTVAIVALHLLNKKNVLDIETDGEVSTVMEEDINTVHTLSFDINMHSYQQGEGAGLLLMKNAAQAITKKKKIFAFIDNYAISENPDDVCLQAMRQADIDVSHIEYLEATASADRQLQNLELDALLGAYQVSGTNIADNPLSCALGSVRSVIGDCGKFVAIAALIKTIGSVYGRIIPGSLDWQQANDTQRLQQSVFYIPDRSRTWYLQTALTKRIAACNLIEEKLYSHVIVSENSEDQQRPNRFLVELGLQFLPLAGDSQDDLLSQLSALTASIEQTDDIKAVSLAIYKAYTKRQDAEYALVILGEEKADLLSEIEIMAAGIKDCFAELSERKTPKGSYFTARPVGKDAGVAYVYPGVGAAYVGLGKNLFHMFPDAYTGVAKISRDMSSMLKDKLINPRRQKFLSFKESKTLDLELRRDLASISEVGVAYAYIFTRIFQQSFKAKADFAMGYSMGEISMFAAMDAWQDPALLCERIGDSATFNHNLTGEMLMLREHWDIPAIEVGKKEQIWETYTLKGTVEEVTAACNKEDRVYLTIVNTPDSLLIGGDPQACQRVIKELGVRGMAMEIPSAIHSAPAFKEYANMEALFTMDVGKKIDTKIYSTSCYLPIPQRPRSIANSIAKCFCEQVDFPRLVNTVYDKGARIFIEMGAGRSCCSWIDKILKHTDEDKPHVSIPVNAKGTEDHVTIFRALAKLVSHRANVDLAPLFYGIK